MTVATSLVFDIRPIVSVQRRESSVLLTFGDGSVAHLDPGHPQFDNLMVVAESESQRSRPVGVLLDVAGRVVDLNEAHEVTVRYVREAEETPDRLKVALWGFSPLCYLAHDHPEFDRLRATLTVAAGTPRRLWLANYSQRVEDDPATEDSEFEVWWKILDVRPA